MPTEFVTEQAQPRWRLVRIYDVRPVDWATGKRAPVTADMDLPHCCRCTKRHAKVYEVTDGARTLSVGSSCVRIACGGWVPEADERRRAMRSERARNEAARLAKVNELAEPIRAAVRAARAAAPAPTPVVLESNEGTGAVMVRIAWGATAPTGKVVKVWGWTRTIDEERLGCFQRAWNTEVGAEALEAGISAVPKWLQYTVRMQLYREGLA